MNDFTKPKPYGQKPYRLLFQNYYYISVFYPYRGTLKSSYILLIDVIEIMKNTK